MGVDVAIIVGTRPEAIKLAPVAFALRDARLSFTLLSSGQHREMLQDALAAFGLRADRDLGAMSFEQSLNALMARLIEGLGAALAESKPRMVVVQGDTATAFAGALAAFHNQVPCAHVEAGLRSGRRDAPWPEELYRQMADRLCTRLYAPTEGARQRLLAEGLDASSMLVTGQTGVDAALWMSRQTRATPAQLPKLAPASRLIYATAHRRENHARLGHVFEALAGACAEFPDVEVVFPLHPHPEVRKAAEPFRTRNPRLHFIEPVDYPDSITLLSRAALVVTDSGGLQEEAPSFGVPVLVTRDVTERPEGVSAGFLRVVGIDAARLRDELRRALKDTSWRDKLAKLQNPYGDGQAGKRIAADLKLILGPAG